MVAPSSLAIAYLDPTALIPIVFEEEPVGAVTQERLNYFPVLVSSNLLEAELRGRFGREGQIFDPDWLSGIEWVQPGGRLGSEMDRIQAFAGLSPTRMWHLANAVYCGPVVSYQPATRFSVHHAGRTAGNGGA